MLKIHEISNNIAVINKTSFLCAENFKNLNKYCSLIFSGLCRSKQRLFGYSRFPSVSAAVYVLSILKFPRFLSTLCVSKTSTVFELMYTCLLIPINFLIAHMFSLTHSHHPCVEQHFWSLKSLQHLRNYPIFFWILVPYDLPSVTKLPK